MTCPTPTQNNGKYQTMNKGNGPLEVIEIPFLQ
jgi:hypothetical protein